ncbi:hypothetical protein R1flu_013908 [Riccia fluitans]|uniref:Uncharacterized protein n=1 Tax=Riccia fluitans TaxID=41844 RepID=A0ABD1YEQ5_9MARC
MSDQFQTQNDRNVNRKVVMSVDIPNQLPCMDYHHHLIFSPVAVSHEVGSDFFSLAPRQRSTPRRLPDGLLERNSQLPVVRLGPSALGALCKDVNSMKS